MSAPGVPDTARLRARYDSPATVPVCLRCQGPMELDRSPRGEVSPPTEVYRCPGDGAWAVRPQRGDPAVLHLIEAYEVLVEEVRVRALS